MGIEVMTIEDGDHSPDGDGQSDFLVVNGWFNDDVSVIEFFLGIGVDECEHVAESAQGHRFWEAVEGIVDVEGFSALDLVFAYGVYSGGSYPVVVQVSVGDQVSTFIVYRCFDESDDQFSVR